MHAGVFKVVSHAFGDRGLRWFDAMVRFRLAKLVGLSDGYFHVLCSASANHRQHRYSHPCLGRYLWSSYTKVTQFPVQHLSRVLPDDPHRKNYYLPYLTDA